MATTPGSKGGYMVNVENMGFIEILRNRSVCDRMGARTLSGLTGNVMFPRQTGKATVTWQGGEGTSVTAADQALGSAEHDAEDRDRDHRRQRAAAAPGDPRPPSSSSWQTSRPTSRSTASTTPRSTAPAAHSRSASRTRRASRAARMRPPRRMRRSSRSCRRPAR
jgi:hypothetical protein